MCVCMCVYTHASPRLEGLGRGRGRRSHRVRTDVVLTALRGDAHGRAGWWLPSRAHSITAFTNNNKNNSNNTHHHQSGHSHSALDSKAPTARGGEGQGR